MFHVRVCADILIGISVFWSNLKCLKWFSLSLVNLFFDNLIYVDKLFSVFVYTYSSLGSQCVCYATAGMEPTQIHWRGKRKSERESEKKICSGECDNNKAPTCNAIIILFTFSVNTFNPII